MLMHFSNFVADCSRNSPRVLLVSIPGGGGGGGALEWQEGVSGSSMDTQKPP